MEVKVTAKEAAAADHMVKTAQEKEEVDMLLVLLCLFRRVTLRKILCTRLCATRSVGSVIEVFRNQFLLLDLPSKSICQVCRVVRAET